MTLELLMSYSVSDVLKSPKLVKALQALGQEYFGREVCAACPGDIADEYNKLQILFNTPKTMEKVKTPQTVAGRRFILKPGVSIYDYEKHVEYTRQTMTDEQAEDYLKRAPKAVKQFEILPEGYRPEEPTTDAGGGEGKAKPKPRSAKEKEKDKDKDIPLPGDEFKGMTPSDLRDYATTAQYPPAEWQDLSDVALVKYLTEKDSASN